MTVPNFPFACVEEDNYRLFTNDRQGEAGEGYKSDSMMRAT
jgi:hypothetical protein